MIHREFWNQQVRRRYRYASYHTTRYTDPYRLGINVQQCSQDQEQRHDEEQNHIEGIHVFLSIAECVNTQIFLHHILIQASHHDRDKHPCQELLPEIIGIGPPPLEVKYLAVFTQAHL